MDTKNIVAAISLSACVIVLYSLFFAPPPVTKENMVEANKVEQNSDLFIIKYQNIKWEHNNTVGPKSISKQEFIREINKLTFP